MDCADAAVAAPLRVRAHRPRGSRTATAGMTLIEVMVALVVVAITLAAGIKAAGALTGNAQRLVDVTAAQWCADNQLTALKLSKQFPSVGDTDFGCEELGVTYVGRQVVRPTPNPSFRRIDTVIATQDNQPLLTLSTILSRY